MKNTKTLFRTLILTATLVAASLLQTHASSFTINASQGFTLIGNHLDVGDDTLNSVLSPSSGVLSGSQIYKWLNGTPVSGSFQPVSTFNGTSWSINYSLAPGEGAFLYSPAPTALTISGSVATPNLPVFLSPVGDGKLYCYSDQHLPVTSSTYYDIVGANPEPGQCIYLWNGTAFNEYEYDEFDSTWNYNPDPINGPPVPKGSAMFIGCGGAPTIPEPGVLTFGLMLCGTLVTVRRARSPRQS